MAKNNNNRVRTSFEEVSAYNAASNLRTIWMHTFGKLGEKPNSGRTYLSSGRRLVKARTQAESQLLMEAASIDGYAPTNDYYVSTTTTIQNYFWVEFTPDVASENPETFKMFIAYGMQGNEKDLNEQQYVVRSPVSFSEKGLHVVGPGDELHQMFMDMTPNHSESPLRWTQERQRKHGFQATVSDGNWIPLFTTDQPLAFMKASPVEDNTFAIKKMEARITNMDSQSLKRLLAHADITVEDGKNFPARAVSALHSWVQESDNLKAAFAYLESTHSQTLDLIDAALAGGHIAWSPEGHTWRWVWVTDGVPSHIKDALFDSIGNDAEVGFGAYTQEDVQKCLPKAKNALADLISGIGGTPQVATHERMFRLVNAEALSKRISSSTTEDSDGWMPEHQLALMEALASGVVVKGANRWEWGHEPEDKRMIKGWKIGSNPMAALVEYFQGKGGSRMIEMIAEHTKK